jgi:energy-coupling factor transporter ATP-binding protein EcfA2
MIERLYVHNFRCLENFEFKPGDPSSVLLIGKNGSGKSTLARALTVLQRIGRGTTRTGELVKPSDCTRGRTNVPMRFSIEVRLNRKSYSYTLALELPERFKEFRVLEESLHVDGQEIYTRQQAQVNMPPRSNKSESQFSIDWHVIALNVIQDGAYSTALATLRDWLSGMVLLAPLPSRMTGDSQDESLQPEADGSNFANWLAGLLAQAGSEGSELITLRAVVEEASELGAARALERMGLADDTAHKDLAELRELLRAWRDAKASAWKAVVAWAMRGVLALLLLGLAVRFGSQDGAR